MLSIDEINVFCIFEADDRGENSARIVPLFKSSLVCRVNIITKRSEIAHVALGKENMSDYDYFLPLHQNEITKEERKMIIYSNNNVPSLPCETLQEQVLSSLQK